MCKGFLEARKSTFFDGHNLTKNVVFYPIFPLFVDINETVISGYL